MSSRLKANDAQLPGVATESLPTISYVAFESLEPQEPLTIAGQLRIPADGRQTVAAVIIVHGSAGVDSRGCLYTEALNRAGIATLEIDLWAARGWIGSHRGRPEGVPETLPDAYGALRYLASLPDINEARIGIMGFSWGGSVAMLTATRPYTRRYCQDRLSFASHVAFYPVCWAYNVAPGYEFRDLTGAPVLIQAADLDTYDAPDTCQSLVSSLLPEAQAFVSVKLYAGATHAFNRLEPTMTVNDPFAHQGQGGEVTFTPNPEATAASLITTIQFFEQSLKPMQ